MTEWLNGAFRSLFTSKERVSLPRCDASPPNAPYFRLSLDQGSAKWHSWRSGIIGASDAPVIMGESPWKSAARLLAEKNGLSERFRGNAKTRRGAVLEPTARSLYEIKNQMKVPPAVLQRRDRLWQCASVDGLDSTGSRVVEIKCGEGVYRHVERYRAPPNILRGAASTHSGRHGLICNPPLLLLAWKPGTADRCAS
jgi:putative phage-type endonuclease